MNDGTKIYCSDCGSELQPINIEGGKRMTGKSAVIISAELENYFAGRRLEAYQILGDCLAGREIPDRSIIIIDLDMPPTLGNVTACTLEGYPDLVAKMFYGPSVSHSGRSLVGTCYKDHSLDYTFLAPAVRGTTIACFSESGSLLWRKPTEEEMKRDHLDINSLEGWNRFCMESASRHLIEQGIDPTNDNIAEYHTKLRLKVDALINQSTTNGTAA